ncbi:MAG: hypothetical protein RhofKO_14190 [Rhodothermales bacterium]
MHALPLSSHLPVRFYLVGLLSLIIGLPVVAQPTDRALAFTDSGYVDLGDPGDAFDFAPGGGRTFAFWLRNDTTLYHVKLLDKQHRDRGDGGYTLFLHQFTGTLGFFLRPVVAESEEISLHGAAGLRPVSDGRWHHVALVQADTLLHAYVDGKLDFTYRIPIAVAQLVSDTPLWLGWNSRGVIHFTGALDEISVWHRALSRSEIRHLMYTRPLPGASGLTAYWPADGDDLTRLMDASGNGHHGTLVHVNRARAERPLSPPFRETSWFYIVLGGAAILVLGALYWLLALRLRMRNRQLEALVEERTQEVGAQAARITRQAEDLKSLDQAKSRFFANVSHEFRTPLTLSLGLLDDVLAGRQGTVNAAVHADLGQVARSNRILLRLVNQLLDVARIESHQLTLHIQHIDLAHVLRLVGAAFTAAADRKQLTFEQHLPEILPAWIDPEQTELIVTNLLSNAFKFTPEGGRVRLDLTYDEVTATLQVRDTGPGIDAAHLPHVFDRFYQTDESHQQLGTGIGLSFVQEVVGLQGGTITVESTVGFGSCFTVVLPITRAHYAQRPSCVVHDDPRPQSDSPEVVQDRLMPHVETTPFAALDAPTLAEPDDQTTLLLVDDNADIRAFIRRHLEADYTIKEAADGQQALDQMRAAPPDLVISDVMMPQLDGFGLVEAMRADPELDFVPIILLTARVEPEDQLAGLGLGADDYLTKPFSTEALRLRVRNRIARQQRLRAKLLRTSPPATSSTPASSGDGAAVPDENGTAFLEQVRAIIREHLAEEGFGVEALAEAMAMERTTLYRRVNDAAGYAPTIVMREVRLDEAARLLREQAGTVSEVAYAVGFQSTSYFGRRFKEQFGATPSQYAASHTANEQQ